ncbi:S8 family serine peptidase [Actinacidiphila soli]|uniref:S8 family serine peptidase n=1 Tax=Actinacidiphila soli TaxID=2487275 RepID=UPI000FCA029E|nr:S8 family serine peptidase [Actinacidiphila soli]
MTFTGTLRAAGGAALAGALLFGTAPVASADSIRDSQWPLAVTAFDAEKVWGVSTGKGVTVAVLDSGVDGTHPDLTGSVLPGKDFTGGGTADRETVNVHGTAMASLIAGHGHGSGGADGVMGLAPDAKILPVKVLAQDSGITSADSLDYAAGLRYAVDHGASVVNMSIDAGFDPSVEEEQAIAYAAEKDVLVVTAAGNDGAGNLTDPASAPGVLAVGAVGKDGVVWEKSNYGPQLMLAAPGEYIRSAKTGGGYRLANGTSDATAYVSAAAALLRAKFPDLTAGQIANRLVKTASLPSSAKGLSLPDKHYGYGFIRPYSALTKGISAGSKQGPLKTPTAAASSSNSPSTSAAAGGSVANNSSSSSDSSGMGTGVIVAIVIGVLVLALVIMLIIVLSKRGGRRNGPGGGFPLPPQGDWQQQPPNGWQQPPAGGYQQQPQHNPYASQQPPPGQWPNQ